LLNIGPLLDCNSDIFKVELMKSKEKRALMKTMMDALSTMFPSANFVKTDVNTNLGFIIGKLNHYICVCVYIYIYTSCK